MDVPHATPPQTPIEPHAGRFSSIVKPISEYRADPERRRAVAILGMPDDTGVKLNNGRPGAKDGPSAIRRALARMGADRPATFNWPVVYDAGDVPPAGDDLDETHRRVSAASAALTAAGLFPIGLGGGHDLTFALVRGVIDGLPEADKPRAGLYLDAHLDVRESTGSGMPFRRLIEQCGVEELRIDAYDPIFNSREHHQWFTSNGGVCADRVTAPPKRPYFASLDMDAIDAAHAPGVSAMNPCGMDPQFVRYWVRMMARSSKVRCFDIMELSPPHDDRDRTARLAAYFLLLFLQHASLAKL